MAYKLQCKCGSTRILWIEELTHTTPVVQERDTGRIHKEGNPEVAYHDSYCLCEDCDTEGSFDSFLQLIVN